MEAFGQRNYVWLPVISECRVSVSDTSISLHTCMQARTHASMHTHMHITQLLLSVAGFANQL